MNLHRNYLLIISSPRINSNHRWSWIPLNFIPLWIFISAKCVNTVGTSSHPSIQWQLHSENTEREQWTADSDWFLLLSKRRISLCWKQARISIVANLGLHRGRFRDMWTSKGRKYGWSVWNETLRAREILLQFDCICAIVGWNIEGPTFHADFP